MQSLKTNRLVKAYKNRRVVNQVSIEVRQGEIVGLLGPNGAGKTTTFYMVVGLIRPDSGEVLLDRDDVTAYPMYMRAQRGISYLPQEPSIFRKLTVEENILAVLEPQEIPHKVKIKRMRSLLSEFNIEHIREASAPPLENPRQATRPRRNYCDNLLG